MVLVGQKTNGKNVGMEGVYLEDGAYEYLFMPVSFQGYNARLETVDPNGLAPDALKEIGTTDTRSSAVWTTPVSSMR